MPSTEYSLNNYPTLKKFTNRLIIFHAFLPYHNHTPLPATLTRKAFPPQLLLQLPSATTVVPYMLFEIKRTYHM